MINLILQSTLALFAVVGIGFFLGKKNFFSTEIAKKLTTLLINLFMPCFIFSNILKIDFFKGDEVLLACIAGYGNYSLALIISSIFLFLLGKNFLDLRKVEKRTFIFSVSLQNYGYLPIPIALSIFADDPKVVPLLLIHNSFVELAIWTVGIIFLTKGFNKNLWKKFLNAPFLTIILSLILNYFKIPIPEFIFLATKTIGQIAIPIALLIVGATFSHLTIKKRHNTTKIKVFKSDLKTYSIAIILRNLILSTAILSFAFFFSPSNTLNKVLILEAAMPAALFPIVISKYYKGSPNIATKVVISTSLVGFITIPTIVFIGLKFLT